MSDVQGGGGPAGSGGAEERADLTGLSKLSHTPPPAKGDRALRWIRAISILLLAVAAAGLPWYFAARGGGGSPKPPQSSTSSSPSTSPSPRGTSTSGPGTYEVSGVTAECLRIRTAPGLNKPLVTCIGNGVRVESDGQTQEADGLLWRHVTYRNAPGWAADQYLKPV